MGVNIPAPGTPGTPNRGPGYGGPGTGGGISVVGGAPYSGGSGSTGGGSPGGEGGGGGSGWNPFAYDSTIASALALANPSADQLQQGYADQSPALDRLGTNPGDSWYGQAQNPNLADEVWVTVPVDKVTVANGKGTVTPVYASADGYRSPRSGHEIPPTPQTGRP